MTANQPRAANLQEAIDQITREFGYPDELALTVEHDSSSKVTRIEVTDGGDTDEFELRAPGTADEQPRVSRVADDQ